MLRTCEHITSETGMPVIFQHQETVIFQHQDSVIFQHQETVKHQDSVILPKNGHFSTQLRKIKRGILTAAKILRNVAEKRRDAGSFGTLTHISAHTHTFLHLYAIYFSLDIWNNAYV